MGRTDEARRWLAEARWDLDTAKVLHAAGRFNSCAFHCQQSAEKAAKGLLYAVGESPFGHSVTQLLARFRDAGGGKVDELLDAARELDRHYVPSRYPNAVPSSTPHEVYDEVTSRRALDCAEMILAYSTRFIEG